MRINLSNVLTTNLFRAPKKILPYIAAGLFTIGTFVGCDRFEKQQEESPKQERQSDKKEDTPIPQESPITNDTTYFNKNGKKIREYDQDSCHVKCEYDSIGNLAKIEKVRMNKVIDATKWYKSVTKYRGNGESTEIQTHYPKVNDKPVHPDSLKRRVELLDMYWSEYCNKKGLLTRPRPIWWNPRREILEQYYKEKSKQKQN